MRKAKLYVIEASPIIDRKYRIKWPVERLKPYHQTIIDFFLHKKIESFVQVLFPSSFPPFSRPLSSFMAPFSGVVYIDIHSLIEFHRMLDDAVEREG